LTAWRIIKLRTYSFLAIGPFWVSGEALGNPQGINKRARSSLSVWLILKNISSEDTPGDRLGVFLPVPKMQSHVEQLNNFNLLETIAKVVEPVRPGRSIMSPIKSFYLIFRLWSCYYRI
jgi:hypothetical protein